MPSGSGPQQISPAPPVELMPIEDEPPTKKIRSEDNLVPEAEFIALHKVGYDLWIYIIYINYILA